MTSLAGQLLDSSLRQRTTSHAISFAWQSAEEACKLLTVLTTAGTYEDIDDLLDLIEENVVLQ